MTIFKSPLQKFKRGKKEIRRLKTYIGRAYRDILRKILHDPDLHTEFHEELELTEPMLAQPVLPIPSEYVEKRY